MPRKSGIKYYPSRGAYYTKINGRQYCLAIGPEDGPCGNRPAGPTFKKASEEFYRIINAEVGNFVQSDVLVSVVLLRYYCHLETEGRMRSLSITKNFLDSAIRVFGNRKIADLKAYMVTDWICASKQWNGTSKGIAARQLLVAINWAASQGLIASNPIRGFKCHERRSRGAEVVLPAELQETLIATARPALARVLRMLRSTGARPGEAVHAQVRHYDHALGAIVLPWNTMPGEWRWKNAKKTKKDRLIYLDAELRPAIEGLIAGRDGKDRIFLTATEKAWNAVNLNTAFWRLKEAKSVQDWCKQNRFSSEHIMCYGFRHTYITNLLTRGCPIKLLADLCGTSVAMIEKTYSHAADDRQAMRRLFDTFHPTSGQSDPSHDDRTK